MLEIQWPFWMRLKRGAHKAAANEPGRLLGPALPERRREQQRDEHLAEGAAAIPHAAKAFGDPRELERRDPT